MAKQNVAILTKIKKNKLICTNFNIHTTNNNNSTKKNKIIKKFLQIFLNKYIGYYSIFFILKNVF